MMSLGVWKGFIGFFLFLLPLRIFKYADGLKQK